MQQTNPPQSPLTIGLIGCGRMGGAMAQIWTRAFHIQKLNILNPSPLAEPLASHDKIDAYTNTASFAPALAECDIVVFAIKPQIFDQVCAELKPLLPPSLPVLSIVTGKKLGTMKDLLGHTRSIIRSMPNTPASIGQGMTVAIDAPDIDEAAHANANFLLSCLGKVEWMEDENLMDAVTAVSGSGPAYIFYLIEALDEAARKSGLPEHLSTMLARETVIGAAALAAVRPETPANILREDVTSPNGTTAAALSILMDGRFEQILSDAIAKAANRSRELSA